MSGLLSYTGCHKGQDYMPTVSDSERKTQCVRWTLKRAAPNARHWPSFREREVVEQHLRRELIT